MPDIPIQGRIQVRRIELISWKEVIIMKGKVLLSALLVLSLVCASTAQLSGSYTIDPNGSGPSNYISFAAASAALGSGVSGPVVFTVTSTTFKESVTLNPVTGVSSTNTDCCGRRSPRPRTHAW